MVRIWCLPVRLLGRQRLLGEHAETHVIWSVLLKKDKGIKAGFQNHPQTLRFEDNRGMLLDRHEQQVNEMQRRGYQHKSPLKDADEVVQELYDYSLDDLYSDYATLKERNGFNRRVINDNN